MQHTVKVKELMSSPVVSLQADTRVSSALELATLHALHHFPVMENGRTVGLVCTCDLHTARPETLVKRWMRSPIVAVPLEATAEEAGRRLAEHVVASAVVTKGEQVQGIVTREDLLGVSEGLTQLMLETRCRGCGVQQHLGRGRYGMFWCTNCRDRSSEDPWFDVGGGD